MTTKPRLERPDELWQGFSNYRGPRGTAIDSWTTEIRKIRAAIEQREAELKKKDKRYKTPAMTSWRLDCLHDLLFILEGQATL
jgi:hypothetical protein